MEKGTVIESTGSWYEVKTDNGQLLKARLRGNLRLNDDKLTNPVAVGDRVVLENNAEDHSIVISKIEPRKNQIIRISPRKKRSYQIIASNIDLGLIVSSLRQPKTKLGFISRLLVTLEYYEIEAVVVFTKKDIYRQKEFDFLHQYQTDLQSIGYASYVTSIETEEGVEQIKEITKGKTSVVTGPSGAGKSSLLNALNPDFDLKTKEVSKYNEKGQHTTTFSRMYELPYGGYIVDTPGIKEYGLTSIDAYELSYYFPEMNERKTECKFNNCQHINEPQCAVIAAVEAGEITEWRYRSYLQIREELLIENKSYL